jgi:uncharacterized protein YdeI (YjbR/CyaY-like superfamily)
MKVVFFPSPSHLRKWFEKHHATERELWVGFFKKSSGKRSVTWPESVDEALCVGWIDSIWSAVNIKRARALAEQGRIRPAGLKAFQARTENRSGIYSYEQRRDQLEEPYGSMLKKDADAWAFFQAQPPSYRKAAGWWVVSARREETRLRRLGRLIADSARGRQISQFTRVKPQSRLPPRGKRRGKSGSRARRAKGTAGHMFTRSLGSHGPRVSAVGLGCGGRMRPER